MANLGVDFCKLMKYSPMNVKTKEKKRSSNLSNVAKYFKKKKVINIENKKALNKINEKQKFLKKTANYLHLGKQISFIFDKLEFKTFCLNDVFCCRN